MSPLRQGAWITLAAAGVGLAIGLLPGRPRLTHMDFVAGGLNALQFCSAENPRFLPVVSRDSPVTLELSPAAPPRAGWAAEYSLIIRTNTGKAVGPSGLSETAGRKLQLYLIDPSLSDFQAPAAAGSRRGPWRFAFTPRWGGTYRLFADFTPVATGQEMYASADLEVSGPPGPAAEPAGRSFENGGLKFALQAFPQPVRLRQQVRLGLEVTGLGGGNPRLQPLGGSGANVVVFDRGRTGLVSLRLPLPSAKGPDTLAAWVSFPEAEHYVVWSRVRAGGREIPARFGLDVTP